MKDRAPTIIIIIIIVPVYQAVIKPIWTYATELWGCASKPSVAIIQRSQPKILRTIANAPWFVSNHTLHTNLNIPYVSEVINERINKHSTNYNPTPTHKCRH
jgi:hypothetical protein